MTATAARARRGPRPEGLVGGTSSAIAVHLTLFALGGVILWFSAFGLVVLVALFCGTAIALVVIAGALLTTRRSTRLLGTGLVAGSLLAGVLQAVLGFTLLVTYSSAHPGWDLS